MIKDEKNYISKRYNRDAKMGRARKYNRWSDFPCSGNYKKHYFINNMSETDKIIIELSKLTVDINKDVEKLNDLVQAAKKLLNEKHQRIRYLEYLTIRLKEVGTIEKKYIKKIKKAIENDTPLPDILEFTKIVKIETSCFDSWVKNSLQTTNLKGRCKKCSILISKEFLYLKSKKDDDLCFSCYGD